jgi:eukaryotic-like serine/threonine-protein kinase
LSLKPEDPALVGGYRLRGRLGEGGMGVVYLAGKPGDPVAIKTMRTVDVADPEARGRFLAEARLAANLDCDYTAQVIDDGSEENFPYLVTEYVPGPSLAEAVRRDGRLPAKAALALAIGIADALAQIHEAGIVHRDVKPSNILLAEDGPRIIDFGIAHDPEAHLHLTGTGMVMGSPGWVAPERLTGGRATFGSDVFCWGLLVAYAATGRHPFGPSTDPTHLAERILTLAPDLTGLDPQLRAPVAAALNKNPAARPSAADLRRDLVNYRPESTAPLTLEELWTPPHQPAVRMTPAPRRRSSMVAVLTAFIVTVLALGTFFETDTRSVSRPPTPTATVTGTSPPRTDPVTPRPSTTRSPGTGTGTGTSGQQDKAAGNGKAKGKKKQAKAPKGLNKDKKNKG